MLTPISKTEIPAIEIIERIVKEQSLEVEIEETVYAQVDRPERTVWGRARFSLSWREKTAPFTLRRRLLDDLRDAPNQHDENWQKLMQKLSTQIYQTLQELGYHAGKIGFRR